MTQDPIADAIVERCDRCTLRTFGLHEHAERKGWRWNTQEITDGLAARVEHIRAIDSQPQLAYALGHTTTEPEEIGERRPLALATSSIARDPDRVVRWRGALPEGFAGAPVFTVDHKGGREFVLRCVGLIANGERNPPVATFDTIRTLIDRLIRETEQPRAGGFLRRLFRGGHL